jgi:hypothetical protein
MEPDLASENLQVIRTLMERSALYRRALAPMMFVVGVIGSSAFLVAWFVPRFNNNVTFAALWLATALVSLTVTYLLVRRQALKDEEEFWSPPARRVSQALLPGFVAGAMSGVVIAISGRQFSSVCWLLAIAWLLSYGCALHAAGFFMKRGFKLFGIALVAAGTVLLLAAPSVPVLRTVQSAHGIMGFFFGALHLLYGAYLHVTERRVRA